MYVRRSAEQARKFPPNYNGTLYGESCKREKMCESSENKHYTVKKNSYKPCVKNDMRDKNSETENGDLLLLGVLIFLYVSSEHSKENLVIMGAVAYLLLSGK